jgi:protein-serine/threonine kinase
MHLASVVCDSNNRIGNLGGAQEIKNHQFFQGVPWDNLRSIRAPFEPKLTSAIDVQNFPIEDIDQTDRTMELRMQASLTPEDGNTEMDLPFLGYTYKRFDIYRGV